MRNVKSFGSVLSAASLEGIMGGAHQDFYRSVHVAPHTVARPPTHSANVGSQSSGGMDWGATIGNLVGGLLNGHGPLGNLFGGHASNTTNDHYRGTTSTSRSSSVPAHSDRVGGDWSSTDNRSATSRDQDYSGGGDWSSADDHSATRTVSHTSAHSSDTGGDWSSADQDYSGGGDWSSADDAGGGSDYGGGSSDWSSDAGGTIDV